MASTSEMGMAVVRPGDTLVIAVADSDVDMENVADQKARLSETLGCEVVFVVGVSALGVIHGS